MQKLSGVCCTPSVKLLRIQSRVLDLMYFNCIFCSGPLASFLGQETHFWVLLFQK